MGIMVYSLLWVMQDFVHQPKGLELPKPCYSNLRLKRAQQLVEESFQSACRLINP